MKEKELAQIVAENLKTLRKSKTGPGGKKLCQEEVATALKMSTAHLRGFEKAKGNPTVVTLEKLATYYGVKVADLLTENLGGVSIPAGAVSEETGE